MAKKKGNDARDGTSAARVVFELEEQEVRLVHKNERLEKHGDEDRLACDLNFEWDTSNEALAMFSPSLRSALYQRSTGPQADLPGTSGPEHLTELKFPEMGIVKWTGGKLVGAVLTFHVGVSEKSHVVLQDAVVHKYAIECLAGGTVTVRFQAQVYPTDAQSGKLSNLLVAKRCTLTIEAPDPGGVDDGQTS